MRQRSRQNESLGLAPLKKMHHGVARRGDRVMVSNASEFHRLPIENRTGSMPTIGVNAQSRSPRGGFLLGLIWRNLGQKLPQALLGRRDAAYARGSDP